MSITIIKVTMLVLPIWFVLMLFITVSFKKKDNIFNAVYKLVIFKRIFDEVKLTAEGWLLFKYVIEKAPLGQAMILNLLFTRRKKNMKILF